MLTRRFRWWTRRNPIGLWLLSLCFIGCVFGGVLCINIQVIDFSYLLPAHSSFPGSLFAAYAALTALLSLFGLLVGLINTAGRANDKDVYLGVNQAFFTTEETFTWQLIQQGFFKRLLILTLVLPVVPIITTCIPIGGQIACQGSEVIPYNGLYLLGCLWTACVICVTAWLIQVLLLTIPAYIRLIRIKPGCTDGLACRWVV